jgi:uncharacterized protein YcbK (DUF882 family)
MGRFQFFTDQELQGLDDGLCQMLSIARGKANCPFNITCGLRTQSQNDALPESVKDSAHLTGNAVDLACADSSIRFQMLFGIFAAGFKRVGIYSAHIHVDNSPNLPSNVCWYVQGT